MGRAHSLPLDESLLLFLLAPETVVEGGLLMKQHAHRQTMNGLQDKSEQISLSWEQGLSVTHFHFSCIKRTAESGMRTV